MSLIVQNEGNSISINKSEETNINVVIQSLSILNTIRTNFLNYIPENPMLKTPLTNSFKSILYGLFNPSTNNKLIQEFMKNYDFCAQNDNNPQPHDPYDFLKHLLEYLNDENNIVQNFKFFQKYEEQKKNYMNNKDNAYAFFKEYCNNTQNSIISNNFYFWEMSNIICKNNNCKFNAYYCSLNPILELDLNYIFQCYKYKNELKKDQNIPKLPISECLNFYINFPHSSNCQNCNTNEVFKYNLIIKSPKVLIIHLKRNNHNGYNDINIDLELDLSNCIYKNTQENNYTKYFLKSCICYSVSIENGYFVDYCIRNNSNSTIWYRFNNEYNKIKNEEINNFEPILLFYEAQEEKKIEQIKQIKIIILLMFQIETILI